jgi:RNA polymerase sigma-70 factor (ECF subfamily)
VARIDGGTARPDASGVLRGAAAVAGQTLTIALPSAPKRPILVNGAAGVVITLAGRPVALMSFAISGGKITEIDAITDPARLARLNLAAFYGGD